MVVDELVQRLVLSSDGNGFVAERAGRHLSIHDAGFGAVVDVEAEVLRAKGLRAAATLHRQEIEAVALGEVAMRAQVGKLHFLKNKNQVKRITK